MAQINKVKKPPATPKLQTPRDVELHFEAHGRHMEEQTRQFNALLDVLRDIGILTDANSGV